MKLLESNTYKNDLKKVLNINDLNCFEGKSFFITGGLGLICSTIVDILVEFGKTGIIYVGARDFVRFENRFGGIDKVRFVQYDALVNNNFDSFDSCPDYIICGAGIATPNLYAINPVETMLSNINGVLSLLEFVKSNKWGRFLYISSSEVYGKKDVDTPYHEESYGCINLDNIRSSYPVAKCASEMLCKSYSEQYGVDVVIVRPGHIYGPSAKDVDKRISSDFSYKAAKGEQLVMKSSGIQKRSYCYSVDCALQILIALKNGKNGESYNIGHDEIITIKQMAEILANYAGVKLIMEKASDGELKQFNPMDNSSLDNTKIKSLGYSDVFSVKEGLEHTVAILKDII